MAAPTPVECEPVSFEVREELGPWRQQWDALVESQPLPSPFLKSWWIENAARATPQIICVTRGEHLVGGAAFEVGPWGPRYLRLKKVTTIGSPLLAPDHIDLIHEPGEEGPVGRVVLSWLVRGGNRLLRLEGLAAEGRLAAMFSDSMTQAFDAPFAALPDDFADYLASRPGRVRSTIRRRTKQLATMGASFSVADADDSARVLEVFAQLHDQRWADESGILNGMERLSRIVGAGMEAGDVLVHELRLESGETVAIEIDFRVGSCLYFYQAGRRTEHEWRGCGSVLRSRIIDRAMASGTTEYDLLRGDDAYKAEWSTSSRGLSNHQMAVGPCARLILALTNR